MHMEPVHGVGQHRPASTYGAADAQGGKQEQGEGRGHQVQDTGCNGRSWYRVQGAGHRVQGTKGAAHIPLM